MNEIGNGNIKEEQLEENKGESGWECKGKAGRVK
jgi:hypothetical protein